MECHVVTLALCQMLWGHKVTGLGPDELILTLSGRVQPLKAGFGMFTQPRASTSIYIASSGYLDVYDLRGSIR